MSHFDENLFYPRIYGDIYNGVPRRVNLSTQSISSTTLANPKSLIFAIPFIKLI